MLIFDFPNTCILGKSVYEKLTFLHERGNYERRTNHSEKHRIFLTKWTQDTHGA